MALAFLTRALQRERLARCLRCHAGLPLAMTPWVERALHWTLGLTQQFALTRGSEPSTVDDIYRLHEFIYIYIHIYIYKN